MESYTDNNIERNIYYLYDNSGICGIIVNGESFYFEKNILGDVISIYNSYGQLECKYVYDAFGNHVIYDSNNNRINDNSLNIGNINPIRYRGYYYDKETGLYYLESRYYDPNVGRFISPDSFEYLDPSSINGLNLYAYCGNDPINMVDPSGHSAILMGMLIGFGIGAFVSGCFEIGRQIFYNGWKPTNWDWAQIGLSALGGGIAGSISAIPIPGAGFLSYLGTFVLGGSGSVIGGLLSGSVTDVKSAATAFCIGGVANVAARGITDLINKGVSKIAQNKLSSLIYDDISLSDLVGINVGNGAINKTYLGVLNQGSKLMAYSQGKWSQSVIYSTLNSIFSSLASGWY